MGHRLHESMTWPLISRDKAEDSKVNLPVQKCTESDNVVLKNAAGYVCMTFFQFIAGCADVSSHSHISFNMLSPTLDNAAEDRGDDLSLVFSSIQPFNHNSHPHPPCGLQHDPGPLPVKEMEQAASLARLERSSAQRRRRLRSSLLRQPRRSGRRKWKSAHSWTQSLPRRNIL